jgi:hypothetical protein
MPILGTTREVKRINEAYAGIISQLDDTLGNLRQWWGESKTEKERELWRIRIDQLLDERIKWTKKRDGFAARDIVI